jgi:hypothetical protein
MGIGSSSGASPNPAMVVIALIIAIPFFVGWLLKKEEKVLAKKYDADRERARAKYAGKKYQVRSISPTYVLEDIVSRERVVVNWDATRYHREAWGALLVKDLVTFSIDETPHNPYHDGSRHDLRYFLIPEYIG